MGFIYILLIIIIIFLFCIFKELERIKERAEMTDYERGKESAEQSIMNDPDIDTDDYIASTHNK